MTRALPAIASDAVLLIMEFLTTFTRACAAVAQTAHDDDARACARARLLGASYCQHAAAGQ